MRGVADDDTGWEEVELDATGGVPGVGTAVDLEDDRDGSAGATEFVGNFGDEAALAFVTEEIPTSAISWLEKGMSDMGCVRRVQPSQIRRAEWPLLRKR